MRGQMNLSEACFYDHCGECCDADCRDWCHEDEEYDWASREWVEREEPADAHP